MALFALFAIVFISAVLGEPILNTPYKRWDNRQAETPPMGWNSYNHYSCSPNESVILSNANALVNLGLLELGYGFATTDCGWTIPERTANGTLTWNETLFPRGFPALGEVIHGLGLKFGVYSDAGVQMCMTGGVNQTGSLYHEQTDADTFSAWGADLLKYDNCYSDAAAGYPDTEYNPSTSPAPRYTAMHQAIIRTGRSILYQICDWGIDFPSAWAPTLGNTWRISNDIVPSFSTIYRIVNQAVPQTYFAGPHRWLDLDMLEVGNKVFTIPEEQTHFSLWAILKSPLVIGAALNDTLTSINPSSLRILKNKDVISYNQDSLGVAANLARRWTQAGIDVWSGPLSGNRTVTALVNWNNYTVNATLDLPDIGLQSAGYMKDIWNNVTVCDVKTSYHSIIPAHGTLLVEIGNATIAGHYPVETYGRNTRDGIVFSNVYGMTTSDSYTLTLSFSSVPKGSAIAIAIKTSASQQPYKYTISAFSNTSMVFPITLAASNANTVVISCDEAISSIRITQPIGTFYASTLFNVSGTAVHKQCTTGLCTPIGAKVTNITQNGTAMLSIPRNSSTTLLSPRSTHDDAATTKLLRYVELTYINNDIAFSTSWTTGRNARNLTISVNAAEPVRLEVPLSGRSSELFSPMKGWGDSATLGVLVGGWDSVAGTDDRSGDHAGFDTVVISNEGGDEGVQLYGADFVGLRVL